MQRINRALFVLFDSFKWYYQRNYHCYKCGRNHLFLTRKSRSYYVHSRIKPCKNGCMRTFSPRQSAVILRAIREVNK